MIRFFTTNIITVDLSEICIEEVYETAKKNSSSIVIVYTNDSFFGVVHINTDDNSQISVVNQYVYSGTENIFEEAHKIFNNHVGIKFIPVIDMYDHVICFCYNQGDFRYNQVQGFIDVLNCVDYPVEFERFFPGNTNNVGIQGLNEIAYHLYKALIKHNCECRAIGRSWELIGIISSADYTPLPHEGDCIKIQAENEGEILYIDDFKKMIPSVGENFRLLIRTAISIGCEQVKKGIESIVDGIVICLCTIPVQMPFVTKWTKDFCSVDEIHNKIQGYEKFLNMNEEQAVKNIYGISSYPIKKLLTSYERVNLGDGVIGKSFKEQSSKKRLYIIGPCIVSGYCVSDADSISNRLQEWLLPYDYEVVRISVSKVNWLLMSRLSDLPLRAQDIILFISEEDSFPAIGRKNVLVLGTEDFYANLDQNHPYFADCPIHLNPKGHYLLAEYIFNNCIKNIVENHDQKNTRYVQKGRITDVETELQIRKYVDKYADDTIDCNKRIGSIVMNCNPFTLGHQYLIENAAGQVDILYIFVVEEDKSFFPFKDRIELVRRGTIHLNNVKIIPSGEFILSSKTFSSYFEKEKIHEKEIDASKDLEIFARYIAPGFGIKYRFVGEEPIDKVTNQYNLQMKEILEEFGIMLIEIKRMTNNKRVISASRVREALKKNDWNEVENFVPKSTYTYLVERWKNILF